MTIQRLAPNDWTPANKRAKQAAFIPFQPYTDPAPSGPGVTFTDAANAKLFLMRITLSDQRSLKATIRAVTWRQAIAFARNRHPNALNIERLDPAETPRPIALTSSASAD
jgi:hypothetical protein